MTYLDAALLDVTEWLCRRFQLLTGRTNVWLAFQLTNLSIVIFFVWVGMNFVLAEGVVRIALAAFGGALLFLLTQTVFKVPVEAYENSAYGRVARGLRNPRRVRDALLRVPFLTLCIILPYPMLLAYRFLGLTVLIVGYGLTVLTTVVLYLLACDPLPPCRGKVSEWLGSPAPAPAVENETSG